MVAVLRKAAGALKPATALLVTCLVCSCGSASGTAGSGSGAADSNVSRIKMGLVFATYDASTNEITLDQVRAPNIAEIYQSPGGNEIYTAAAEKGRMPEVFLVRNGQAPERLTDNTLAIEFSPVVNDGGDYAYAVSESSMKVSNVVLNGVPLAETQDGGLYKHLDINDRYLVFVDENLAQNLHYLCVYQMLDHSFRRIPFDGYIQRLRFLDRDTLLVQAYRLQTRSSDLLICRLPEATLEVVAASPADEVVSKVSYGHGFTMDTIEGSGTALQLFNAYYEWTENQMASPFAATSDARGRLSWNTSYRLEGMIEMVRLTGDPLVTRQVEKVMQNLLAVRNQPGTTTNPSFLWSTTAYSVDLTTPISLMVDNSMIMYPMLRAVNAGIGDAATRDEVIAAATKMYDHFEPWYNASESLYHAQKGIAYWADGVWLPYNQQNIFGLVLIELYKATGNVKYKQRAISLAKRFKSEMVTTEDDRVLWHYWPKEFYAGWSADQMISDNTPSRDGAPIENADFEDISHAGLNVNFIVEFRKAFGDVVFTGDDMAKLLKTVAEFTRDDGTFTVDVSGDIAKGTPSYRYIPHYGWSKLGSPVLAPFYRTIVAKVLPYFDAERLSSYLNDIPQGANDGSVTIRSTSYDTSLRSAESSQVYSSGTVRTYFVKE